MNADKLPLVTLVTPTYNQAQYLAETIDSVLAQDYPNIEYIVIDDGSTDETPSIIKKYTNKIRSIRQKNIGQAATINKGWDIANGQILGYLSSDDTLEKWAISELVNALIKDKEIVVVYGDYILINNSGEKIKSVITEEYNVERLTVDLICQPGPGALLRRSILNNNFRWRTDLKQIPDFEFWLNVSKIGAFQRVPVEIARYRVHQASTSFIPMKVEQSEEIVNVVSDFWAGSNAKKAKKSIALAKVISAKQNLQSGRVFSALKKWLQAILSSPGVATSPYAIKTLVSGLIWRIKIKCKFIN